MIKAFKFRIYPNKEQRSLIAKTFGCTRFVWNHALAMKEQAFSDGKKGVGLTVLGKDLTQLKRDNPWLSEVDSQALQQEIRALLKAYDRFFKIQETGPKYTPKKAKHLERIGRKPNRFDLNGHPQFKRKKDDRKSYTSVFNHNNIAVTDKYVKLPKLGLVRYRDTRKSVEGQIIKATISQEPSGKYYVSVCCKDVPSKYEMVQTGKSVGIDLGIKEFAITSDGQKFVNMKFLKNKLKRLKQLQRALSRKTKDGSRWKKNKKRIAILHERIRHARLDYQHKLSTELLKHYDMVCLESLKIKNMIKNHKLAQAISDVAWGQFVRLLQEKADGDKKRIIQIDTYFASSQTCSKCGYINKETKDLSVREWTCPNCGTHHDRDINAAKNILTEGLKQIA